MLLLAGLDDHVAVLDLLADDLSRVDLVAGLDEEDAPVPETVERVARDVAGLLGDHRSLRPVRERTTVRAVLVEEVVHQGRALGQRQELETEAEQTARRNRELQPHAVAVLAHVLQLALALAHRSDDGPREL